MNDKKRLQLKVLIKARMSQLRYLIGDSENYMLNQTQAYQEAFPQVSPETHLVNSYRAEWDSLAESLSRLESDQAGLCETCGKEIDYNRLIAILDCRLCLVCEHKKNR